MFDGNADGRFDDFLEEIFEGLLDGVIESYDLFSRFGIKLGFLVSPFVGNFGITEGRVV